MLHVSFNRSCYCVSCVSRFNLGHPGFHVTHIPQGNFVSSTISDHTKNIMAPSGMRYGIMEYILIHRVIYLMCHVIYLKIS